MSDGISASQVVRVRFEPQGKELEVPAGITIWEAARRAGMPVGTPCAGELQCGMCRLSVLEGAENLLPASGPELRGLRVIHAEPDERLACRARITGPVILRASYW